MILVFQRKSELTKMDILISVALTCLEFFQLNLIKSLKRSFPVNIFFLLIVGVHSIHKSLSNGNEKVTRKSQTLLQRRLKYITRIYVIL